MASRRRAPISGMATLDCGISQRGMFAMQRVLWACTMMVIDTDSTMPKGHQFGALGSDAIAVAGEGNIGLGWRHCSTFRGRLSLCPSWFSVRRERRREDGPRAVVGALTEWNRSGRGTMRPDTKGDLLEGRHALFGERGRW